MNVFSKIATMFKKPPKRKYRKRRESVADKIIASFDAGNTTKEGLCAKFPDYTTNYLWQVLHKSGRKWTVEKHGNSCNSARDTEIVSLRRSGMMLTEIGAKYGITRERVRQILRRLAPDLTDDMAREARLGPKPCCQYCGTEMPRGWKQVKTCGSPECHDKHMNQLTTKQRERGEKILSLRATGMKWEDIGRAVLTPDFAETSALASQAQAYAKTYAKKTGEDISWAFQGTKGVHSPRLAERIIAACRQSGSRFAVHKEAAE